MAIELKKLRREVKKLHEDFRGGAIRRRNPSDSPQLPTEPERRLRSISPDETDA